MQSKETAVMRETNQDESTGDAESLILGYHNDIEERIMDWLQKQSIFFINCNRKY